jgi:hypothetical protein
MHLHLLRESAESARLRHCGRAQPKVVRSLRTTELPAPEQQTHLPSLEVLGFPISPWKHTCIYLILCPRGSPGAFGISSRGNAIGSVR